VIIVRDILSGMSSLVIFEVYKVLVILVMF